jgi:hypothetical protein
MTRLDNYQSALLAAFPETSDERLAAALDAGGATFPYFIIDHGLGPMWHERTGREDFQASRRTAEALYLAQSHAIEEIDAALESRGIVYAVIKGAANRQVLYANPAVRACHDVDLLVRSQDRIRVAEILGAAGFRPVIETSTIGHELEMRRDIASIDLHWGVLREGRLRSDPTHDMLRRRRRVDGLWMLERDDAFSLLLVHPAFAKHLAGWEMGLHRVADIITWMRNESFDLNVVEERLTSGGVRTAAWATFCWAHLIADGNGTADFEILLSKLAPGSLRRAWLTGWMCSNLSERTSNLHWVRLLGFSLFLHDRPKDALRALIGRYRAHRRRHADTWAFRELQG